MIFTGQGIIWEPTRKCLAMQMVVYNYLVKNRSVFPAKMINKVEYALIFCSLSLSSTSRTCVSPPFNFWPFCWTCLDHQVGHQTLSFLTKLPVPVIITKGKLHLLVQIQNTQRNTDIESKCIYKIGIWSWLKWFYSRILSPNSRSNGCIVMEKSTSSMRCMLVYML